MQSHYEHIFANFKNTCVGHDQPWLHQARQKHLAHFLQQGFPTRKQEAWKYTPLTAMEKILLEPVNRTEQVAQTAINLSKDLISARVVFVDGHYAPALSATQNLPSSVLLCNLSQGLAAEPERIKAYLEQNQTLGESLHSLNLAFLQDGLILIVPKHVNIESPIHIVFISSKQANQKLSCMRNWIHLEEGAQATVLEEHIALEENGHFQNIMTEIKLDNLANLSYCKIQPTSSVSYHYAQTFIEQAKDSSAKTWHIAPGANIAREDLTISLIGQGAHCEMYGLYLPNNEQHVDFHTTVHHKVPHTTSSQHYHGVLSDQASAVFNGKVHVVPQAKQIAAKQTNHNLLLSKQAQVNTKPELEIYADDVKCSHGATVGQLDETALFYLRSRGINKSEATRLLLQGFTQTIIADIPNADIKDHISKLLEQRIQCFSMD